jgi:hypothetical protein
MASLLKQRMMNQKSFYTRTSWERPYQGNVFSKSTLTLVQNCPFILLSARQLSKGPLFSFGAIFANSPSSTTIVTIPAIFVKVAVLFSGDKVGGRVGENQGLIRATGLLCQEIFTKTILMH